MLTYTCTYGLSEDSPARMIRTAVFMEEQGFHNEFDIQDHDSYHFVFYANQKAIGCARLFPSPKKENWMTIGRVAILKEYRKKHYGLDMLEMIENEALKMGASGLELSAQQQVQPFYEKGGYIASGPVYMDEHCPHIHMEKAL